MLNNEQAFSKKAIKYLLKQLGFEKVNKRHRELRISVGTIDLIFDADHDIYEVYFQQYDSKISIVTTTNFDEFFKFIQLYFKVRKHE